MSRALMIVEQQKQSAQRDHAAEVAGLVRQYVARKRQPGETWTDTVLRLCGDRESPAILRRMAREEGVANV